MSTGVPENRIISLKTLIYQIKGTSRTQGSTYSLVVIKILEEGRHQPKKRKDKVSRGDQGRPITTYPKTQRPMSILVETSLGLGRGHKGLGPKRVTEARITSGKTLTYQVKEHGQQDPLSNSNLDQEFRVSQNSESYVDPMETSQVLGPGTRGQGHRGKLKIH